MATPLGASFSTDKNPVAQADIKLHGRTVESLVVDFEQEKFEEFLSSGSATPRQCGSTTKFLRGFTLESLQRFLQK